MKRNNSRKIRLIVISLIACSFLAACGDQPAEAGKRPGAKFGGAAKAKSIPVEANKPTTGLAASFYVTTATIEPSSDAKINSRATGIVKQLLHEEGDDLKSGDVLMILDDQDQQLRLKQAQQNLASASREFKRLSKMKKAGVLSPTEWEAADTNLQTADTEKQLAELALSYTRIAAPIDGRVVKREVDLGGHVAQGELLFRMMSIRPLLIRVHIPANRLGKVAPGQAVKVIVDSSPEPLQAAVELVSPIVDPTSGTIKITLRLDQYPSNVRPGDFAEIHMMTDQRENALLVNSVSIIEERGSHFVYVVEQGLAKRKAVTLGFVMNERTEIAAGITAKDQVVVKGQRNLNDDVKVEVLAAASDAKPVKEKREKKKPRQRESS